MSNVGSVIALALTACFFFSFSASIQQRASAGVPVRSGGLSGLRRLMLHLVQSPLWMLGIGINIVGFLTQAVALERGSVALVQPLMPTQLMFAVAFAAWSARAWPTAVDWICSACICGGVALVVGSESGRSFSPEAGMGRVPYVVAAAAVAIVVLLVIAHGRTPRTAAVTTAMAAGVCFAMTAVFLKLVADEVGHHGLLHLVTPPLFGLLTSTTLATILTQAAFAAGPLPWAVSAMTIVNPVVSYTVGLLAFHASPPGVLTTIAAAVLLIVGVVGLVTSSSAHDWSPLHRPEEPETPDAPTPMEVAA
ncbi:MAG: DMT family transporter [Marmoricola sp.]